MRVSEARAHHLAANGFSEAAYTDRWLRGPLGIPIFNPAARRRAIKLHDLHHLATGYGTSLRGEAEISAWELGGGCRDYWVAWLLDGAAALLGLVIAPRRTWRAFRRGRRATNLYHLGWSDDLLEMQLDELKMLIEG
jgi:ubiquinone biosynthesis protein Coq4